MPRVPEYSNFQVATGGASNARFDAPVVQNAAPQQMQQLGQAVQGAGNMAGRIATDMQTQANQVLAMSGMNSLRQYGTDLTEGTPDDPTSGFLAKKGEAALKPGEDGFSATDQFSRKLRDKISEVAGGLTNDPQRQMFLQSANEYAVQFNGKLQRHMLSEHTNFQINTYGGAGKLAADQAERNWQDSDGINKGLPGPDGQLVPGYMQQVKSATTEFFRLKGITGTALDAELAPIVSAVHTKVIAAALQNDNPTYATRYLDSHKGEMTAGDILKTTGLANHALDSRQSLTAVQGAVVKLSSQIQPTDMDRLKGIRDTLESGGKDYKDDGSPVVSSAGARYKNQVMPETAKKPGFGIAPAKDDSPAEYNRVGDQLLEALVKKYGNSAQAMAAYNAGFGNVDKAIADATKAGTPDKWLDAMVTYQSPANHAQTVGYVKKAANMLGSGGGAPQFPTENQFVQSAIETLGVNPRIEQLKMTHEQATAQYHVLDRSRKAQAEQVVQLGFEALAQNGGSFARLDPHLKAEVTRYAPGRIDDLMTFGAKIAKGQPVETDWSLYYKLKTDSTLLGAANLMSLRDKLGETEFKNLTEEQQNVRQGKTDITTRLRSTTDVVNQMMRETGIDPTPKGTDKAGAAKVGRVWASVEKRVREEERTVGRPLKTDEVGKLVAKLFTTVSVDRTLWSTDTPAVLVDPGQELVVPQADRLEISGELRKAKKPVTDEAIQALYRRSKGIK